MAVKGVQYLSLELLASRPQPRPTRAGLRRLPRPDHRHRAADRHRDRDRHPARRRDRGLDRRVRAPVVAGARGRVRHRDRRRHARHRDRDLRPGALPAGHLRAAVLHRRGRRRLRPLVPHRRGDDVAHRAADGLRRHARGAAGDPARTCARPPTRWARRRSPRSAASCCPRCGRTSRPARRSAWAASPATRRSSSSCSARRCASIPRARSRASSSLRGTGSTLTSYVYNNSPAGEGNAPAEGLRRRVRAAADRPRPELRGRRDRQRGARTGLESTRLGA